MIQYYKIIRNGLVVGAGTTFLKWSQRHRRYFYCELEEAQAVQDVVKEVLYTADWLRNSPSGATELTEAEVVLIDAVEYDEIVAELTDGEEIPVPDPDPDPEPPAPDPGPDHDPERPMTVQEMREAIAAMQESMTDMTAKENISKGSYFVLHDVVYRATSAIVRGKEIKQGRNCERATLTEAVGNN